MVVKVDKYRPARIRVTLRKNNMKNSYVALLFAPLMAFASGAALHLDKGRVRLPTSRRCKMVPSCSSTTA